jgi:hypothetical protein
MRLDLRGELPFVTVTVGHRGTTVEVPDVLVDTGSASTLLNADVAVTVPARLTDIRMVGARAVAVSAAGLVTFTRGTAGWQVEATAEALFLRPGEWQQLESGVPLPLLEAANNLVALVNGSWTLAGPRLGTDGRYAFVTFRKDVVVWDLVAQAPALLVSATASVGAPLDGILARGAVAYAGAGADKVVLVLDPTAKTLTSVGAHDLWLGVQRAYGVSARVTAAGIEVADAR